MAEVQAPKPILAEKDSNVPAAVAGSKPTEQGSSDAAKHPLQNKWTFYYRNPKLINLSWNEQVQKIYTFDTVEDFWALFNSVVPPTRLPLTADYYLFKELGKAPQYESFPKGGVWSFNLPKKGQGALVDPNDKKRLEDTWLNLVMSMIGETLEDENDICGAVVSIRRNEYRVQIWTQTAINKELQIKIGKRVREALSVPSDIEMNFKANEEAAGGRAAESTKYQV